MFVDTAGTERFGATCMMSSYFRKADAFVLVYDITQRSTFEGLTTWMNISNMQAVNENSQQMKVMLIGNKADLKDAREVPYEEGMKFAKQRQMRFFETSAKTGSNITETLYCLVEELAKQPKDHLVVELAKQPKDRLVEELAKQAKDDDKRKCLLESGVVYQESTVSHTRKCCLWSTSKTNQSIIVIGENNPHASLQNTTGSNVVVASAAGHCESTSTLSEFIPVYVCLAGSVCNAT